MTETKAPQEDIRKKIKSTVFETIGVASVEIDHLIFKDFVHECYIIGCFKLNEKFCGPLSPILKELHVRVLATYYMGLLTVLFDYEFHTDRSNGYRHKIQLGAWNKSWSGELR